MHTSTSTLITSKSTSTSITNSLWMTFRLYSKVQKSCTHQRVHWLRVQVRVQVQVSLTVCAWLLDFTLKSKSHAHIKVISLWCKQNVSINCSVHSHSCQSSTPYVSVTVTCSLSLSHQCHTQQMRLHLRKISAETRASDICDLNGRALPCWKRILSVNWTLALWELGDDMTCPVVASAVTRTRSRSVSLLICMSSSTMWCWCQTVLTSWWEVARSWLSMSTTNLLIQYLNKIDRQNLSTQAPELRVRVHYECKYAKFVLELYSSTSTEYYVSGHGWRRCISLFTFALAKKINWFLLIKT